MPGKLVGVPLTGEGAGIDARFVQKGRDLRPPDDGRPVAVVEGKFGDRYALRIPADVLLAGGERVRLVGQVLQPEQFLVTRPGADFGVEAGYAYLYAPLAAVQALSGREGQVNELVSRSCPARIPRSSSASCGRRSPRGCRPSASRSRRRPRRTPIACSTRTPAATSAW